MWTGVKGVRQTGTLVESNVGIGFEGFPFRSEEGLVLS